MSFSNWTSWLLVAQGILMLALIMAALGYRFGVLPFTVGFYGFGLSLIFIVGLGMIGLLIYLGSFLTGTASVRSPSVAAFGVGLAWLLLVVFIVGPANFAKPLIHDITTDWRNPPEFVAALDARKAGENTLVYPGEILGRITESAYPEIKALEVDLDPARAFERARETVEALGWEILAADQSRGVIEAFDRTPFLGFTDDIAIRITATETGSRIDLRSVSRVGQGDFGANARRIQTFYEAFAAER